MKISGKKKGKYEPTTLQNLVGKTIEAVEQSMIDGNYGKELCVTIYFTDKTQHGFVLPKDEE
jgi:hypothetical protein